MEIKGLFIPQRQMEEALNDVQQGNLKSGPLVLRYFVQCVESGKCPDIRAMNFLANAFETSLHAYHTGHKHDLNETLGLRYSKGRPKMRKFGKAYYAVKYGEKVAELRASGETYENAVLIVANHHKKSITTIQDYCAILEKMSTDPA
jgi:hypothetical protein